MERKLSVEERLEYLETLASAKSSPRSGPGDNVFVALEVLKLPQYRDEEGCRAAALKVVSEYLSSGGKS